MSTAPGQLFGYHLQLQRALVHLLQSGRGSSVSIEVTGDVAVKLNSGEKIEEEDKSSLSKNPVADKSTDLWKTFHNWINAINSGSIHLTGTKFVLYANHKGNKGVVNELSDAKSPEEIEACVKKVESLFQTLEKSHPIYDYLSNILINKNCFVSVVKCFDFIVGSKSSSEEIKNLLSNLMLVSQIHVDYIHDELIGWVTNSVMKNIATGKPANIFWEDYQSRFLALFERVRARDLIDFTKEYSVDQKEVQDQLNQYPKYLRQLKIIDIEDKEQVLAVSDFLRRNVNADKWIESELIDEASAQEFEESLRSYWESTFKRISITQKSLNPEERGQLLYYDCKERQSVIGSQQALSHFVRGTYHNLANESEIGWHELWQDLVKDSE